MDSGNERVPSPVVWMGNSKLELAGFPRPVRLRMGLGLHLAQIGQQHWKAKPLSGFGGASVLQLAFDHAGDTFRTVYTVRFADGVYVLHVFQKKSKTGISTPRRELELIRSRLLVAERLHGRN